MPDLPQPVVHPLSCRCAECALIRREERAERAQQVAGDGFGEPILRRAAMSFLLKRYARRDARIIHAGSEE